MDSKASDEFGETLTIPFVLTYEQGSQAVHCPNLSKPEVNVISKTGDSVKYHLNGPLLNLVELRHQIEAIYRGSPKIGFVGFNFEGTIVLAQSATDSLGLDIYFVSPSVARTISDSFKITYKISTNWQPLVKDYISAQAPSNGNDVIVAKSARPPMTKASDAQAELPAGPVAVMSAPFTLNPLGKSASEKEASDLTKALEASDRRAPPANPQ